MPAGRPPKPTALKILHGDDKKNPGRINRDEPKPNGGKIEPTEPLNRDAREVWDRLAPDLARQGVLTAWDCDAFTQYCLAIAQYREATAGLEETGLVIRGLVGSMTRSPYWALMMDAQRNALLLAGRFGLTPADRTKIHVGGEQREPGADLLSG